MGKPIEVAGTCWRGIPAAAGSRRAVGAVFDIVTGEPFKQSAELTGEPIKQSAGMTGEPIKQSAELTGEPIKMKG